MKRQFTIITKDGSKWLRPVRDCIEAQEYIDEVIDNAFGVSDVPYIGSRPDGKTLDESEVREVRQWRNKNSSSLTWWNVSDGDNAFWIGVNAKDYLETRLAYTDAESHDHDISGWTHVSDALPDHLETVWLSNGKGFTTLGCLVWTEDGWHWAATNGVIYEENGKIVSECESDDIAAEYWHRLPDALKIDKEVKK